MDGEFHACPCAHCRDPENVSRLVTHDCWWHDSTKCKVCLLIRDIETFLREKAEGVA